MTKKKRDILYGIVLIVFAIVNIIYANTIEQTAVKYTLAKPDVYMELWLGILIFLAVLLIIRTIRQNNTEKTTPIWSKLAVITTAIMVIYLLLLPHLGFRIDSLIFMSVLTILYGLKSGGPKKTKKEMICFVILMLIFSVCMTLGSELLFREVLKVRLPSFKLW